MDSIIVPTNLESIDDLLRWYPSIRKFYFSPGNYYLTRQFDIKTQGIIFESTTKDSKDVHLFQLTPTINGLNIEADNVSLKNISIHCEHDDSICLTVSNASRTSVTGCRFFGSQNNFTIYYAGKRYLDGNELLNGYLSKNMDSSNIFDNNIVYTQWSGDAVSFSLQYNGTVRNNVVRGGKLAIYCCRDTFVTHNLISDSTSQGIYLSTPTSNVRISNNRIMDSTAAAIKIDKQREHPLLEAESESIDVSNNYLVDSKYFGIEVADTKNFVLSSNKIYWTVDVGIYMLRSSHGVLDKNIIAHYNKGIVFDVETKNILMTSNWLASIYPEEAQHSILLEVDTSDNVIRENKISGETKSDQIKNLGTNTIVDNTILKYHQHEDEQTLSY